MGSDQELTIAAQPEGFFAPGSGYKRWPVLSTAGEGFTVCHRCATSKPEVGVRWPWSLPLGPSALSKYVGAEEKRSREGSMEEEVLLLSGPL